MTHIPEMMQQMGQKARAAAAELAFASSDQNGMRF